MARVVSISSNDSSLFIKWRSIGANGGQCKQMEAIGAFCMHGELWYYVLLLCKGWANEQVTRIMSNVEPVVMSVCFSEVRLRAQTFL